MKAKQAHPENPGVYYQMGEYFVTQKKYDDGIREFEQALRKNGDSFQVLSAIISADVAQGKPERAIARLAQILKKQPGHPFAHELLAEVYIAGKRYSDAESELLAAIKANPEWSVPYRNLANLYLVRGDIAKAEAIYAKGLQAMPENADLLLHLARSYEATRDLRKAAITYEKLLQKYPSSETAANNLALILADRKGDNDSLERARALVQRFKSSPQPVFRDTLGWVYYRSGETDKAVIILEEVVKQAPTVPIYRYHLGMAYYLQGNMVAARTNLTKAVEAKKDFSGLGEARATLKLIP
jgi:tetratricopeptide (TPR) repeat protein